MRALSSKVNATVTITLNQVSNGSCLLMVVIHDKNGNILQQQSLNLKHQTLFSIQELIKEYGKLPAEPEENEIE